MLQVQPVSIQKVWRVPVQEIAAQGYRLCAQTYSVGYRVGACVAYLAEGKMEYKRIGRLEEGLIEGMPMVLLSMLPSEQS